MNQNIQCLLENILISPHFLGSFKQVLFFIIKDISLKVCGASIDYNSSTKKAEAEDCKFSVNLST